MSLAARAFTYVDYLHTCVTYLSFMILVLHRSRSCDTATVVRVKCIKIVNEIPEESNLPPYRNYERRRYDLQNAHYLPSMTRDQDEGKSKEGVR